MKRHLLVLALALMPGCSELGALSPRLPGAHYRDMGVAEYAGKPLLGTHGEFESLVVSPSGKQVAFVGRESNTEYELFIADVDGAIRKLVSTGQSPTRLRWSSDEGRLMYRALDNFQPGQPVAVGDVPTGEALHVVSTTNGQDIKVTDLPGRGVVFPAPSLETVAVHGWLDMSRSGGRFNLIDVASGDRKPLEGDLGESPSGLWSPDGQSLYVFDEYRDQGPLVYRAKRYQGPDWKPEEIADNIEWPGYVTWRPDGQSLWSFAQEGDPSDPRQSRLRVSTLLESGEARPLMHIPLGVAPPGYRYYYEGYQEHGVLPCPDGKRVLLHRRAVSEHSELSLDPARLPDPRQPPDATLVIDLETGAVDARELGVTPMAWLDEHRVLAFSGRAHDQDKVLSVLAL